MKLITWLLALAAITIAFFACTAAHAQTNVVTTNAVVTVTPSNPEPIKSLPDDITKFIEANKATFMVAFAWLAREFWTIGASGGLIGLWKYFVYGIKPATLTTPESAKPTT